VKTTGGKELYIVVPLQLRQRPPAAEGSSSRLPAKRTCRDRHCCLLDAREAASRGISPSDLQESTPHLLAETFSVRNLLEPFGVTEEGTAGNKFHSVPQSLTNSIKK
jgi:hypothetical protein